MAGKEKFAKRLAELLGAPVEAACPVVKPGSTMATAMTAGVGGAVGAAAATVASQRGGTGGEIAVTGTSWLGVGPDRLTLNKGDMLLGRPKGEPYAVVPYADIAGVTLTEGKITLRADVALHDGRTFAFEAKRIGPANKPNVEVLELLRSKVG